MSRLSYFGIAWRMLILHGAAILVGLGAGAVVL